MLTDQEWDDLSVIIRDKEGLYSDRNTKFLAEYEKITGYRETNSNAIFHHIASQYGPPCAACNKPLRTPRATFCAACGAQSNYEP
ncbi:hypothetical protein BAR1_04680 [Profundibacter amoris]|uniref:Uncharacterized protein n=1 Tax=Profundibacter amoris TaxID=2171755 RepID=A0A347ULG5_9RHOB|nr:hypothetical protein BAR1_04680 [Profundibacter amoris]